MYRIPFVKMYAPLHGDHQRVGNFTDHHFPGVPNRGRLREMRNIRIRNFNRTGKFIRERPESRSEHQRDFGTKFCFQGNEVRSRLGLMEFTERVLSETCRHASLLNFEGTLRRPRRSGFLARTRAHERIPTIDADIRFAMVPASMARIPNFASCCRWSGASAPMPPI